jgi:hypothetical protein
MIAFFIAQPAEHNLLILGPPDPNRDGITEFKKAVRNDGLFYWGVPIPIGTESQNSGRLSEMMAFFIANVRPDCIWYNFSINLNQTYSSCSEGDFLQENDLAILRWYNIKFKQ